MRIGDTIDPSLYQYDPTPFLRAQSNATATIGAGLSGIIDRYADEMEEGKQFKDEAKAAKEQAKALKALDPKLAPFIDQYLESFENPDASPRQLALHARQMPAFVEMFYDKQASERGYALQDRQVTMQEQGQAFNQNQQAAEWQQKEDARSEQQEFQAVAAPAVLADVMGRAKQYREQGTPLPFSDEQLQRVLQEGTPAQKLQMAALAESYFPQGKEPVLRDIKFTNADGQASEGTAQLVTGANGQPEWRIVPIAQAGTFAPVSPSQLPAPLKDYADDFNRAGEANGIDPRFLAAVAMHETGGGTSPAFRKKNNAMGISDDNGPVAQPSVEASIDRQARSINRPGGHYEGLDTIEEIWKKYAPPKGATNDPRGLNRHWPAGVSKYYADLGGNPKGSVRAGATTRNTPEKTPAELQKEQLDIQKLQGDVETRKAEVAKQTDAKATAKASAEDALGLMKKLKEHSGFNSAVGVTMVPGFIPGTDRKGAEAIIEQLKGHAFLNSIQQLRGLGALSDAEGKKLEQAAARLGTDQSEKDFKVALEDYEKQITEVLGRLGGTSSTNPATDYSSRLRAGRK